MNVIFLDIDGVLNSHIFYEKRYKKRWAKRLYYITKSKIKFIFNGFKHNYNYNYKINPKHYEFNYTFKRLVEETDQEKWQWLSEFCNEHDYKICISSVWKNHFKQISQWNDALIKLGFNDNIFVGITGERRTLRGTEIQEWIDNNDVTNYTIIDDDSDMLKEQMKHFFHVDGYFGLTPNTLYRINRFFNKLTDYSHLNESL